MMTLSFLMCFFTATLIRVQAAADCKCTYDPSTDTDCAELKKHLTCLENAAETKDGCTLSEADAKKIKDVNCGTALVSACKCQREFWGSDKDCGSLEHYAECLNTAPEAVCEGGPKASVIVASLVRRSDPKCSTSTTDTTTTPKGTTPTTSAATITGNKSENIEFKTLPSGSGASPLRMYSAIASFLPFVLSAFRL